MIVIDARVDKQFELIKKKRKNLRHVCLQIFFKIIYCFENRGNIFVFFKKKTYKTLKLNNNNSFEIT